MGKKMSAVNEDVYMQAMKKIAELLYENSRLQAENKRLSDTIWKVLATMQDGEADHYFIFQTLMQAIKKVKEGE
jgi:hypothetical protein